MATFAYTGRSRAGQTVTGEFIADSRDAAVAALRRDQILVTVREARFTSRVNGTDPSLPVTRRCPFDRWVVAEDMTGHKS